MNQVLLSKQATEESPPFPYGTIHGEIPETSPAAAALASAREEIAEEDLAGRGLDVGPIHITLRYGIQGKRHIRDRDIATDAEPHCCHARRSLVLPAVCDQRGSRHHRHDRMPRTARAPSAPRRSHRVR